MPRNPRLDAIKKMGCCVADIALFLCIRICAVNRLAVFSELS
jgi:hypothetical protein